MATDGVAFTALDLEASDRFVSLRRPLGVTGMGLNLILLEPGQRGRVHDHERQEEVYLVWDGTLTLVLDGAEHDLERGMLARVSPGTRRQLVNRGPRRCAIVALGGEPGAHVGRDGIVWASWDDDTPAGSPQEAPLPADLPADQRRHT